MYRGKKVSMYFPCRNEEPHVRELLARVPTWVDEIIVVSNRSTDRTLERARELGTIALRDDRVEKNGIGYGYAHMTGMRAATGEIIVAGDGDLTYPIERAGEVIDDLLDHGFDFLSCNRYPVQEGTEIPFMLRLGVAILNWEVRLLYGMRMKDILSGMWVFTREARDALALTEGGWNLSPEIKLRAATNPRIRFGEHAIGQYARAGRSKQHYWQTGFSHLWWIFRNRFAF